MGSYVIGRSVAEDSTDFDILSSLLLALGLLMLVLNFFADDPPKYTDFTGTPMERMKDGNSTHVVHA